MEFRPCIDIHNGKVKQIVGKTLSDINNCADENFVSSNDAVYYAELYKQHGLKGGHVILLNKEDSKYFEETKKQALGALAAYPNGLQIGGGVNEKNAEAFILAGASAVIVTSYLFDGANLDRTRMKKLVNAVGREHLVFDLSCKMVDGDYHVMTNRWQTKTEEKLNTNLLKELDKYCCEFLIHAVDVEGKTAGIEEDVVSILGKYDGNPITYAGGIHSLEDLQRMFQLGNGRVNITIGSALDLFGGTIPFKEVVDCCRKINQKL